MAPSPFRVFGFKADRSWKMEELTAVHLSERCDFCYLGRGERLNQLRSKSRDRSDVANIDSTPRTQLGLTLEAHLDPSSQNSASLASTLSLNRTHDAPEESRDDTSQTQSDQSTLPTVVHTSGIEQNFSANHSTLGVDIGVVIVSSDIWSTAYREAVESLGKDIDDAILKGENVAQLFRQLEEVDKEANQESIFLRCVKYLNSLPVPLEKFKLALNVASPLANTEPTATIVFGVVRGVTAIAISFATAGLEFAKIYEADDLCFPPILPSKLPPFPAGDWNYGRISQAAENPTTFFAETSRKHIPSITPLWHANSYDYLSFKIGQRLRANVYVASSSQFKKPIIAKFARFEWETEYYITETQVYSWINGSNIGPEFLGYLTEEGRVIGSSSNTLKAATLLSRIFLPARLWLDDCMDWISFTEI